MPMTGQYFLMMANVAQPAKKTVFLKKTGA